MLDNLDNALNYLDDLDNTLVYVNDDVDDLDVVPVNFVESRLPS